MPSRSTSALMPAASLPTASRRPSSSRQTSSRVLLTSIPITHAIPCPHLVYGLVPTNRSGSEEQRGGIMLSDGLSDPGFVPISDPARTPRARGVRPTSCHIPARQGSFGFSRAFGFVWLRLCWPPPPAARAGPPVASASRAQACSAHSGQARRCAGSPRHPQRWKATPARRAANPGHGAIPCWLLETGGCEPRGAGLPRATHQLNSR